LTQNSQQIKIKDFKNEFGESEVSDEANNLLILISYLSSCGIRISTVYEVMKIKPTADELYSGNDKLNPKYICHFLRDNVCHKEPGDEDKKKFKKRQKYLEKLKIEELYESVREAIMDFKKNIVEFSCNYSQLEVFMKNKFKDI
jgi:hypothetical protein